MKTIGHLRVQVGDAYLLGTAYRALEHCRTFGLEAVSDAGMVRFRALLEELRLMAEIDRDVNSRPVVADVWGVAR